MTDLLTDFSHYSIQTANNRPDGATDKLQFWELARLSFGHPENLAPLPKSGGNPLPVVADCEKKNNQKSNEENMNDRKKNRPRGRPRVSGVCKLSKAVTVKFS
ncbi:MAG: hypothetical protein PUJ58_05925, partial [Phocaeicola vulgatus]|nr:hypothetical protein [Phocaeicola vulgatus]